MTGSDTDALRNRLRPVVRSMADWPLGAGEFDGHIDRIGDTRVKLDDSTVRAIWRGCIKATEESCVDVLIGVVEAAIKVCISTYRDLAAENARLRDERDRLSDAAAERDDMVKRIRGAWSALEEAGFPPEAAGWPFIDPDLGGAITAALDCLVDQREAATSRAHRSEGIAVRAEANIATPEMLAAAWGTWHARHGGRLGPGPAFREAIEAALTAAPQSS